MSERRVESKLLSPEQLAKIRSLGEGAPLLCWGPKVKPCILDLLDHIDTLGKAYERAVALIDESAQSHLRTTMALAALGTIVIDTTEHGGACLLCGHTNDSVLPHDECPVGQYIEEHG